MSTSRLRPRNFFLLAVFFITAITTPDWVVDFGGPPMGFTAPTLLNGSDVAVTAFDGEQNETIRPVSIHFSGLLSASKYRRQTAGPTSGFQLQTNEPFACCPLHSSAQMMDEACSCLTNGFT